MACPQCDGIGLIRTPEGLSAPCVCQVEARRLSRIRTAKIPAGFEHATLENFTACPHTRQALLLARRYAEEFPPANNRVTDTQAAGLLLTGSVGTGKTHLAVGIVKALADRGFRSLFVDVRELLDRLKRTYDRDVAETQASIMGPIFAADLVVIDELGAQRPTEWTFETVECLIGGLYNRMVATIVTTNLPNQAAGAAASDFARVDRRETLCERIGMRMWSRLQQMCRTVEMNGPDWRTTKR